MTLPEIILGEAEHHFLVAGLARVLRRPEKRRHDRRHGVLAQLKLAGLDPDEPILSGGFVASARYGDLVEALATHRPDPCTAAIEPWQIVNALGEHGNIWPVGGLADREEPVRFEGPALAA